MAKKQKSRKAVRDCTAKSTRHKLAYVHGMIQATLGSVCDYSADALRDRMRFMVAFIEDDETGKLEYGQICFREQREQHPEIFCPEDTEPVQ